MTDYNLKSNAISPGIKRSALLSEVFVFIITNKRISIGGGILLMMICIAIFAPWLTTKNPSEIAPWMRARPPSSEHWFGTDMLGRDIYSRVIYGARVSLLIGFSVALMTSLVGLLVGLIAGYIRWADNILMRIMDGIMSIPSILLAIALMALTRGSMINVIIAVTIADAPQMCRLVRSVVLSTREQVYVESAVAAGVRTHNIILRHILPSTFAPLIVQATFICASAMLVEATLSFIGAGIPPTTPSWGNIMADGRGLWQVKPFIVLIPAAFLSLTILSVNLLGDGLRDLLDTRQVSSI